MNPKVIIFDLDSTLSESKQPITDEMGEALHDLLSIMPVAVMSGADLPQFQTQLLPFIKEGSNLSNLYLFPTSAAECLVYHEGKWTRAYDFLFTEEEKKKIYYAFEEVLKETGIVDNEPSFGERIEDRGEQITFSALGQNAPLDLKTAWDPDHKKRTIIRNELLKIIPEFEIGIGGTTSIDITHKDISKEDGIKWLEEQFQIPANEMLYVGDALFEGGNDAEVKKTNVKTQAVTGPLETLKLIREIINNRK